MRTLFLIDGEHYPPVVMDAMCAVRASLGAEGVAAAFLGGTEKIKAGADYGLPLVTDHDPVSAVEEALSRYAVDAVVDLSDEPVVGYRERMRIASLALAAGARYIGSDFELRPPELHDVSAKPSLAVIGTGKRVGKTAISGYLARLLAREGFDPGVVSMGRGGPPEPEVIEGHRMEVGSDYLLEALERGSHAASDYYETAALSRVVTVGCRRCGGGLAGEPFVSNVLEGRVSPTPSILTLPSLTGRGRPFRRSLSSDASSSRGRTRIRSTSPAFSGLTACSSRISCCSR